jgi:hypothetical protein
MIVLDRCIDFWVVIVKAILVIEQRLLVADGVLLPMKTVLRLFLRGASRFKLLPLEGSPIILELYRLLLAIDESLLENGNYVCHFLAIGLETDNVIVHLSEFHSPMLVKVLFDNILHLLIQLVEIAVVDLQQLLHSSRKFYIILLFGLPSLGTRGL